MPSKNIKIFLANTIAIVVAVIVIITATMSWLNTYTHHGDSVVVPDIKGMTIEDAIRTFESNDLIGIVSDSIYAKNKPLGTVLDSSPAIGSSVKRNRIIRLTINSQSIPLVRLPDLINNSSYRQAELQLTNAGFKLTEPELINGEQDWIYGIRYQGRMLENSDKVQEGATLTLVVGNGNGELSKDSVDADAQKRVNIDPSKTVKKTATKPAEKNTTEDSWF